MDISKISYGGTEYNIKDAYARSLITAVYKPAGSVASVSALPVLSADIVGNVYNFTTDFTTDADFIEGAGKTYPAGTNVVVVDIDTTGENPSYKYDVLSGTYGVATSSGNGLMSSTDKSKLDTVSSGANANVIEKINYNGSNLTISNKTVTFTAANQALSNITSKATAQTNLGFVTLTESEYAALTPDANTYYFIKES